MSFGFSIADFITLLQLTNTTRKRFVGAPKEFSAVSGEIKQLGLVLQDIDDFESELGLNDQQRDELNRISQGCFSVLSELQDKLDGYRVLDDRAVNVKGKAQRVWKRVLWDQAEIDGYRQRIASKLVLFNVFLGRINSGLSLAIKDGVDRLNLHLEDQRRQEVLDWLAPVSFTKQQGDALRRRQQGTGMWPLAAGEFQQWLGNRESTLLCPGIPGAGKTILASVVVDHLQRKFEGDQNVVVAYLYCNFQQHHEQKLEQLFESLLKQLSQSHASMDVNVRKLCDRYRPSDTRPSLDGICGALHSVAASFSRVFIVVDALDECPVSAGLVSKIFDLQRKLSISFMATTRYIPEIIAAFEGSLTLDIRASYNDVRTYVEGHLSELPSFVLRNAQLQEEIVEGIAKAADGMFLLAYFHLHSLVGKKSPRAVRNGLKQLPFGSDAYDVVYQRAMERIDGQVDDQKRLAKQLQHALAVELGDPEFDEDNLPEIDDIVSACAGLVIIGGGGETIHLVHYTTQEYFERTRDFWFANAHRDIGDICVTYLSFDTFDAGFCKTREEYESIMQRYPLYKYASQNWGYHCKAQLGEEQLLLNLLRNKAKTSACAQALLAGNQFSWNRGTSRLVPMQMTGVHVAAYFGLVTIVRQLSEEGELFDIQDYFGRTPLSWAAKNGHQDAAKALLQQGGDVESEDKYGQTPLSRASEYGQDAIVRLLLEQGADPESKDKHGQSPLSRAAENNHEMIIEVLLQHGAVVDTKDNSGQTPLARAVQNCQETAVMTLLDKGADPNIADRYGSSPLSRATWSFHRVIERLLGQCASNIESKSGSDETISRAMQTGRGTMSKMFDEGTYPNTKHGQGQSPLSRATWRCRQRMIEHLLDKGANIESKGINGQTALANAAQNGQEIAVNILLAKAANPDPKDTLGRTPLAWAAVNGHEAVVKLLLGKATDPNSRDSFGRTPLLGAAAAGHVAVVQVLLDTEGVDQDCEDMYGRNALTEAKGRGWKEVVRLLLGNPDNSAAGDYDADTIAMKSAVRSALYYCDICLVYIPELSERYHCEECDHFDICRICIEHAASCLGGHMLDVKSASRPG